MLLSELSELLPEKWVCLAGFIFVKSKIRLQGLKQEEGIKRWSK